MADQLEQFLSILDANADMYHEQGVRARQDGSALNIALNFQKEELTRQYRVLVSVLLGDVVQSTTIHRPLAAPGVDPLRPGAYGADPANY